MNSTIAQFQSIEANLACRLGVAAYDSQNNQHLAYNSDKLWPLCSTFKFLLAAAILAKIDNNELGLTETIPFGPNDLLEYAPITTAHLPQRQMTVSDLCQAALCYSDNTAANLLFPLVGGPNGLTNYLRSIGDPISRLDRTEPFLNESIPNDPRDTTSPAAMIKNMESLLLKNTLSPNARTQLNKWLIENTTGDNRLRAGIPTGWQVGDKTGTGDNGTTNDIAIIWPPHCQPILIAAYITETTAPRSKCEQALAQIAHLIINEFQQI